MSVLSDVYEAVERMERIPGMPDAPPARPGRQKCFTWLRFANCTRGRNCQFDHPKPIRPEAQIEADITASLPELSILIGLANRLREGCVKAGRGPFNDGSPAYDAFVRSASIAASLFFEAVSQILPLSPEVISTSTASPERVQAYLLYFLWDVLPKTVAASDRFIKGIEGMCKTFQTAFVVKENDHSRLLSALDQSASFFADLDEQLGEFAREQTVLMCEKGEMYEGIQAELFDALAAPFQACGYNVTLDAFGSVANSLGSPKSDLDFSISATQERVFLQGSPRLAPLLAEGELLKAVLECLELEAPESDDNDVGDVADIDGGGEEADEVELEEKQEGGGKEEPAAETRSKPSGLASSRFAVREYVPTARVPVLRLRHIESGTDIDLIVSNIFGMTNTQLLRQYAYFDPRARPLILAVKKWSSAREVNDSQNSTLSSYSWVLLVIFFLQLREPPILPNLQAEGEFVYVPGKTSLCPEKQPLDASSPAGTGFLLFEFFRFYGLCGEGCFNAHDNVAAVRFATFLMKPHSARRKAKHIAKHSNKTRSAGGGDAAQKDSSDALAALSLGDEEADSAAATAGDAPLSPSALMLKRSQESHVARSSLIWRWSIEDPIDATHDLGNVLHNPLGQAIIASELRRGVQLFQTALASPSSFTAAGFMAELCQPNLEIPDLKFMRDCCRLCQEKGHLVKNCPLLKCDHCGAQGHLRSRCPLWKKDHRAGNKDKYSRGGGGGGGGRGGRGGEVGGRGAGGGRKLWSPTTPPADHNGRGGGGRGNRREGEGGRGRGRRA